MMILAEYRPEEAKKTWMRMNRWQSVQRKEANFTVNLQGVQAFSIQVK